jgi:hypothetical protein
MLDHPVKGSHVPAPLLWRPGYDLRYDRRLVE